MKSYSALLLAAAQFIAPPLLGAEQEMETLYDSPIPSGKEPLPVQVWRKELPAGDKLSLSALGQFTAYPPLPDGSTTALAAPWRGELQREGQPPIFVILTQKSGVPAGTELALAEDAPERNGQASATGIIQTAIDKARPGLAVVIPAGIYKIGTLKMRDGVELHLTHNARLESIDNDAEYPPFDAPVRYHRKALILFDGVKNAALTGSGIIDGRGSVRRRAMEKPTNHPDIKLVHMQDSSDIRVENVHLRDAYSWTLHVLRCTRVTIRGVSVLAEYSPRNWNGGGEDWIWNNADGINPDSSSHILIEDCMIYAGDDAIAIKNSDPLHTTSDITVRGCSMWSPTRGLKIGTETRGESMTRITFEDCDVIRAGEAMAIDLLDTANLLDITYRAVRAHGSDTGVHFLVRPREPDQAVLGSLHGVRLEQVHFGPATDPVRLAAPHDLSKISNVVLVDARTDMGDVTKDQVTQIGNVDAVTIKTTR